VARVVHFRERYGSNEPEMRTTDFCPSSNQTGTLIGLVSALSLLALRQAGEPGGRRFTTPLRASVAFGHASVERFFSPSAWLSAPPLTSLSRYACELAVNGLFVFVAPKTDSPRTA